MSDEEWITVGRKEKRKSSKSSSKKAGSSSSSPPPPPPSVALVTSTPKIINTEPFNANLQTMYYEIRKEIKENEKKMYDCSNINLVNYLIRRNDSLSEQQMMLLKQPQQIDSLQLICKKIDDMEQHLRKLRISKIKELDIWPGNRTQIEQAEFKDQLIVKYECGHPNQHTIKCMVLNAYFNRDVVRASHIWKYCTQGIGLTEFGLRYNDLNCYRNGLLMYTSIEQAFDRKELCFIYDPFQAKLILKILHKGDDGLMNSMILDKNDLKLYKNYTQFKDIDGKSLSLPKNVYPFRQLLNWHARCAHEYAKTKKWISTSDNFDDFYDLSDLVSLPGDDLNEEDII
ncbi:unnamed protein product [Rotaria magnacalcarata]